MSYKNKGKDHQFIHSSNFYHNLTCTEGHRCAAVYPSYPAAKWPVKRMANTNNKNHFLLRIKWNDQPYKTEDTFLEFQWIYVFWKDSFSNITVLYSKRDRTFILHRSSRRYNKQKHFQCITLQHQSGWNTADHHLNLYSNDGISFVEVQKLGGAAGRMTASVPARTASCHWFFWCHIWFFMRWFIWILCFCTMVLHVHSLSPAVSQDVHWCRVPGRCTGAPALLVHLFLLF